MKIVDAKVIITCPGRNFVTLKVVTEDGVHGLGDATLNGRELAVASYLTDHVIPCLIGRDARRIEDIWQYLYKGAYWRRGPVTMSAIAPWTRRCGTSRARRSTRPVYDLIGGRSRDSVLVYGHANGRGHRRHRRRRRQVRRRWATRPSARRAASPGSPAPTASAKATCTTSPPKKGLPSESLWSTEKYLNFTPTLFKRLREEFGDDLHLLHDVASPVHADRSGASGQVARAVSPVLARGRGAGRGAGKLPLDPPAHDDAAGRRRDLQHHPRLLSADPGAADRLHPHRPSSMPAASRTCARSPRWPSSITCGPAGMAPPT